jgi:hypothetical protein
MAGNEHSVFHRQRSCPGYPAQPSAAAFPQRGPGRACLDRGSFGLQRAQLVSLVNFHGSNNVTIAAS